MKKSILLFVFLYQWAFALEGVVKMDGSSTVFPLTEAVAEEFQKANPKVRVLVGVSGTGGGFKKFTSGEIDITGASRPIKTEERKKAKDNGIGFIELPVAYDGIVVVTNPKNTFIDHLTVQELKKIWNQGSQVKTWKDVRPTWPNEKIYLYGPGADSGTFDYFTSEINGKSGASRPDYTASEDDNVLVQGVKGQNNSLGYFGYAYYKENQNVLRAVAIKQKDKAIMPSDQTIKDGSYAPLSRPVFIYVSKASLSKPQVEQIVTYYVGQSKMLSSSVGFVPLSDGVYKGAASRLQKRIMGTSFGSSKATGVKNIEILVGLIGE